MIDWSKTIKAPADSGIIRSVVGNLFSERIMLAIYSYRNSTLVPINETAYLFIDSFYYKDIAVIDSEESCSEFSHTLSKRIRYGKFFLGSKFGSRYSNCQNMVDVIYDAICFSLGVRGFAQMEPIVNCVKCFGCDTIIVE